MEPFDDLNDVTWWPAGPIVEPSISPSNVVASQPKKPRRGEFLAAAVIGGLIGGGATLGGLVATDTIDLNSSTPSFTVIENAEGPSTGLAALAAKAIPSIARVVVLGSSEDGELVPFATGSAVGFTSEGHLVTNAHVVADAQQIEVELLDGRVLEAQLIGTDPLTDVAVIKIPPGLVPPIPLGNNTLLAIGDTAIAVGNPRGLQGGPSVTTGIISAFGRQLSIADRDLPALVGLIQTDAPISGGSSGGALLNANGELIGITTAKSTGSDTEGLGFAIPVDLVLNIALTLVEGGTVEHPFLGILGTTHTETLPGDIVQPAGARIAEILGERETDLVERSAFGEAGALVDDIIVAFDGNPIRTMPELAALLRYYRADQTVEVDLIRDGQPISISLTLDRRPEGV